MSEGFETVRKSAEQEGARQEKVASDARRKAVILAAALALLVSLLSSVGSALLVVQERGARVAYEAGRADEDRRRQDIVARSATQLDDINRVLASQGKPPIQAPGPGEDSTDAIAKVVLGQVLTQLPATPDAQQVGSAIAGRVTDNLLGTTRSQVVAAAGDYLTANPAPAGPPPTQADIDAAVDAAYRANPPPAGPPGDMGAPGPSPACLSEPGQCRGPAGDPGAAGRSVTGQRFVATDSGCTSEVSFSDGAVQSSPAGDAACPGPVAPPDPPEPTTTDAEPSD